ncbi:MAG: hypothetical protein LT071_13620, partial [Nocardioides sp.]|nr:hypothetical protein [Nocardioides sp.]
EAAAALDRLVRALERRRYSLDEPDGNDETWREDLDLVEQALVAGVSPGARRRATWLPLSVTGVGRPAVRTQGPAGSDPVDAQRREDHLVG